MVSTAGPDQLAVRDFRGALEKQPLGARGLVLVARNSRCTRLRVLSAAGLSPATVVRDVFGIDPHDGQSPFAFSAGNQFEAVVLRNEAERLQSAYRNAGLEIRQPPLCVRIDDLVPGRGEAIQEQRVQLSEGFLRGRADGRPNAPDIILKPKLRVFALGSHHLIEPDALVALAGDSHYTPVEIKSYLDRESKTDPSDIRSACLQAALAYIAIQQSLGHAGYSLARPSVPEGHLVFREPGSSWPRVRPMTLSGEVNLLTRTISEQRDADEIVREALSELGEDATLDDPDVINQIPNHYSEGCLDTCALSVHCKECAVSNGELGLLGTDLSEILLPAGSIGRALELLRGSGAPPQTEQEEMLARQLRDAEAQYVEAIGG